MSGKGSGRGGYQGWGSQRVQGGRGRGRDYRGYSYSGSTTKQKGLCSVLGIYVFDYGHNKSADQMRTTWKKLLHHVETINGHDISNGLLNKKRVTIPNQNHNKYA